MITVRYPTGPNDPRRVTITEEDFIVTVIAGVRRDGENVTLVCTADSMGVPAYAEHHGESCPIHEPGDSDDA